MRSSTDLPGKQNKKIFAVAELVLASLFLGSLLIGKYPFSVTELLKGNAREWNIFTTLRLARALTGLFGGFVLGVTGFVYQTVFRNPLASPDIIGVSSGASAGAALGILLFGGAAAVTATAFFGALLAVGMAVLLASSDRTGRNSSLVLSGIAVHAVMQAVLMSLKILADPERQLSAIEFWIMGSLAGVRMVDIKLSFIVSAICVLALFLLHRQTLLLSQEEGEAMMLGADVKKLRILILLFATLAVAAIVSITGLISFIGLLAPHTARLLTKDNKSRTMLLSGLLGAALLLLADILARSIGSSELPVSIFTSIMGAPFLIVLAMRKGGSADV